MIKELARIVRGDGKNIISSGDIRELTGILNSLLVIYQPEDTKPDQPAEARRPVRAKREHWWSKFTT